MADSVEPLTRRPRALTAQSRMRVNRIRRDPKVWELTRRVAKARRVSLRQLLHGERQRGNVAQSRHLAIYMAHVLLGLPQDDIAFLFSRSRTTVTYACHAIEMMRDDPIFDAEIDRIEGHLRREGRILQEEARHAA